MDLDLLCTYMLLLQTAPRGRGRALERFQNKKVMYYGAEDRPTGQGTLTESYYRWQLVHIHVAVLRVVSMI